MPRPIFFLPGIMGSRLSLEDEWFWDPDSHRRMVWWLLTSDVNCRQIMHASRPATLVQSPLGDEFDDAQQARGWGGVVWSFYGEFLKYLESLDIGPVHAVGYDWRQDIIALGEDVTARIRRTMAGLGADSAVLITHSMGGLVARSAFRSDPDFEASIERSIFICPPSVGAVVLYRRLFTGLLSGTDGDWKFRWLLGRNRRAFVGNVSGTPGAMQLLPSRHYSPSDIDFWHPSLREGTDFGEIYPATSSPPGIAPTNFGLDPRVLSDLRERLIDIRGFHEFLGDPRDSLGADRSRWHLIYGDDGLTEVAIDFATDSADGVRRTARPAGDTIVPAASATALGLPPERSTGIQRLTHAEACANGDVQRRVKSALE